MTDFNPPKLFGQAAAVLVGGALIFGLVVGKLGGFWALLGVGLALYLFVSQLNAYEARDIRERRRKKP